MSHPLIAPRGSMVAAAPTMRCIYRSDQLLGPCEAQSGLLHPECVLVDSVTTMRQQTALTDARADARPAAAPPPPDPDACWGCECSGYGPTTSAHTCGRRAGEWRESRTRGGRP